MNNVEPNHSRESQPNTMRSDASKEVPSADEEDGKVSSSEDDGPPRDEDEETESIAV